MNEHKKRTNKLWMRIGLVALCLVMAFGTTVTIMASSFNGDLDGDGQITAYDAQMLAEYQAGNRDLDPATVIGLTVRGILDRVLGRIIDEPVEEPTEESTEAAGSFEDTMSVKAEDGIVTEEATLVEGIISVTVPVGTKVTSNELIVTVKQQESAEGDVTLEEGQELMPLDIHVEGVAADNTVPIVIRGAGVLDAGLNVGNLVLYHVENGETVAMTQVMTPEELTAHNTFYYDPATGDLAVAIATFSAFMVVSEPSVWEGKINTNWYDATKDSFEIFNADQLAGFGKLVDEGNTFAGKTVTLCMDVTLSDGKKTDGSQLFYPIGYGYVHNGGQAFKGTFDGNGNTIYNLYQNGWAMDEAVGEAVYSYNTAGGGLFASVCDATIKNLTMDNAYVVMECIDMGTVVGYAQGNCTFENIIVRNSTLANYQRYTGGVIGEVSDGNHILKNVDVEASTTIGSLWGDFDNASGGLIGGKWGINGENSVSVYMENCDVAATLDVYNDVTSAYQWYSYRRCGMLIGMSEESVKDSNGRTEATASYLTTKNCTVQYGDWAKYHYCEFGNTTSLNARYPWVRVEKSEFNGAYSNPRYGVPTFNGLTLDVENHTENDGCHITGDGHNVEIVFNQLYGGGQGCYGGNKHVDDKLGVTVLSNLSGKIEPKVKFEATALESISTDKLITLGELFKEVDNADIQDAYVYAFISPATAESEVSSKTIIPIANTDWQDLSFKFSGTGMARIVITDYNHCIATARYIAVGEKEPVKKFETKFTGDFLYRVGNVNAVALGSLFKAVEGADIGTVAVKIENVAGNADGNYTPDATWTKGEIQFSGTGVVKVTINDNDAYCTPKELTLEVVDAWNTTTATSAPYTDNNKKYNVVLLNDVEGATNITVSDGYYFCGNGFKLTYTGDGSYSRASVSYGFVTVENGGVLDNVQVICNLFPQSYLYTSEMTTDSSGRYPYGYSAVVVSGNSTISNCYIYGARNNILVSSGNVRIENTVTECGSLANIHIKSMDEVTLHNLTTIQYMNEVSGKKVLGFGVVVGDNESTANATIVLTGDLVQYNWVTQTDANTTSNSYAQTAISNALKVEKYQHTKENGTVTVNTGIAVLNNKDITIKDERTNTEVKYEGNSITMLTYTGYVYSIIGKTGNPDSENADYAPETNNDILPSVGFISEESAVTCSPELQDGVWVNKLTVDLDNITGGSYTFKFNDLLVQKQGVELAYTIKDSNGNAVSKDAPITLNQLTSAEYTLVVQDNQIYDSQGNLTGATEIRELPFILYATKTSIDPPKFTGIGSGVDGSIRLVSSSGGNWRPAYPALEGVSVEYWSASEGKVKTVELSTLTTLGTISGQTWTYTCEDYTLKITGGPVHTTTSYVLSPMIATRDGQKILYFAAANKDNSTGTTARMICLEYVFTDKNASTTVGQATSYSNGIATVQYADLEEFSWSSFQKGTVEAVSSGGGNTTCLAAGTMITLADGSKKAVEDLRKGDLVMSFDHVTGTLTNNEVIIVVRTAQDGYFKNTFVFDDGTELATINEHGIFDLDLNKYVNIDHQNYREFIGHRFVSVNTNGKIGIKRLVDVDTVSESGYKYDIVTNETLNYVAEDTLSVTHVLVDVINSFDFGKNLKYDAKKMQADIAKYGLYSYDEWAAYCDVSVFEQYNIPVMKVGISKGLYTKEYIISLINTYVLDDSVQIID